MISEKLGIDEKDQKILSLLQENPGIAQSEIAEKISLSQPSVGMRIQKLKHKGLLDIVVGMNFKKVGLYLAKVDVSATDTQKVLKSFEGCPFFLNGLITSGKENLCLFFMGPDMVLLEGLINYHLRAHPAVTSVQMDIVISPVKDLIFPVSLCMKEPSSKKEFIEKCKVCPHRKTLMPEKTDTPRYKSIIQQVKAKL